jgi:hypothetical protein
MWDDDIEITANTGQDHTKPTNWKFEDENDDIIMHDECMQDRFHYGKNLKTLTISNFIQLCFISDDGTNLFEHVYAPILGTREVLIRRQHIPEAMCLIYIMHVELCRVMNHKAITKAYDRFDDILQQTTVTKPWQPFDIQAEIKQAPGNDFGYARHRGRQKRNRIQEPHHDHHTLTTKPYTDTSTKTQSLQ